MSLSNLNLLRQNFWGAWWTNLLKGSSILKLKCKPVSLMMLNQPVLRIDAHSSAVQNFVHGQIRQRRRRGEVQRRVFQRVHPDLIMGLDGGHKSGSVAWWEVRTLTLGWCRRNRWWCSEKQISFNQGYTVKLFIKDVRLKRLDSKAHFEYKRPSFRLHGEWSHNSAPPSIEG